MQLVLHDSEHLPHRVEDAARELFLVVDAGDPLGQHLGNLWFEHLRNLQFNERFSVQNLKILLLFGLLSKG